MIPDVIVDIKFALQDALGTPSDMMAVLAIMMVIMIAIYPFFCRKRMRLRAVEMNNEESRAFGLLWVGAIILCCIVALFVYATIKYYLMGLRVF